MNIQLAIGELEQLGYSISLEGENIRCKYLALIEPPKDKVIPLLDTLKRNKQAVIDYLEPKQDPIPFEVLRDLYLATFNRIGWKVGLMDKPEDRLNEIWLKAMEGQASIEDFKRTLAEWEKLIGRCSNGSN
ncbi:MAG: hypothetical protein A3K22_03525 [Deltaproteobacteria bacterium RBG_16_42_7]|nr:MAG: hypothetical protein A3K22_03525 [Deltaproteobacteria bacterium RBG_16_42_7]